jgi:predicted GIY-YIG superfamily endonuclease
MKKLIGFSESLPLLRPEKNWFVYMLIHSYSTIPYIGKTNDLTRRLRQHNGEISGGAKRTHKAIKTLLNNKDNKEENVEKWIRVLHIKGFIDERAALHFENRFQRERRKMSSRFASNVQTKSNSLLKGIEALKVVMKCDRPTRAARLLSESNLEIVFENEEAKLLYCKLN